jgi:DNA-binding FadR family transcriptional regulator
VLRPIPRRSLSDAVFEQLRDEIVTGALAPGAPLPAERVLCESLGVNRGAVREALRRLEQARLVSVRHGGTSQVLDYRRHAGLDVLAELIVRPNGALDLEAVRGVMEMRSAVAPDIARLAALRGGSAVASKLDQVVHEMRGAKGDAATLQRLAIEFWARLVEGSENLAYGLVWNTMRQTYEQCLPLLTGVLAEENGDLTAHGAIAAAVRRGDGRTAESRARTLVGLGEAAVSRALDVLATGQREARG